MFWLFFPLIVCILTLIISKGKIRSDVVKTSLMILLVVILAYITSFGSAFSADSEKNILRFQQFTSLSSLFFSADDLGLSRDAEVGYNFLCYLGNLLHLGGPGFLFVLTFIMNLIIVKTIFRFPNAIVTMLGYICSLVYVQQTNLVRQSLAVSIFVLVLYFIDNKKKLFVFSLFVLSVLIHTSAIITLPFVLLCFFDYSKYIKGLKILIAVVWLSSLLDVFGIIGTSWTSFLLLYYLSESSYGNVYDITDTLGTVSHFDILGNILFVFLLFFYKAEKHSIYVIVAMSACVLSNFAYNIPLLNRPALYFTAAYCCLWGNAMSKDVLYRHRPTKKGKLAIGQIAQIVVLTLFLSYIVLKSILYDNIICQTNLLGTEFYPLSDFFRK